MKPGSYAEIAAAVLLAQEVGPALEVTTTERHKPVGVGRIVGHDFGKGLKTQPRNKPCQCGSGLKAKKCCVYVVAGVQK